MLSGQDQQLFLLGNAVTESATIAGVAGNFLSVARGGRKIAESFRELPVILAAVNSDLRDRRQPVGLLDPALRFCGFHPPV